ncbi:uncharacterized protein LOC141849324 [Brevipalpus obovatus]|uniref:uncharacterized protein LOC141849324 n=1 Tax=Brevipalpus obovatus TaxID=246614 RepID=UPI003D9DDA9A
MPTCLDMECTSDSRSHGKLATSTCCSQCNSQIFGSYLISLVSSFLIAIGFYLAILKWDHLWLILSIFGCLLIFIGACMYYSGQRELSRRTMKHHHHHHHSSAGRRRRNKDRSASDYLMSSNLSESRSVSQFSINMIPQYFSNSEVPGSTVHSSSSQQPPQQQTLQHQQPRAHSSSISFTQILRINGQSFLILPLSNETTPPQIDNSILLESLMVKMPPNTSNESKETGSIETSQILKMHSPLIINKEASPQMKTSITPEQNSHHLTHYDFSGCRKEDNSSSLSSKKIHTVSASSASAVPHTTTTTTTAQNSELAHTNNESRIPVPNFSSHPSSSTVTGSNRSQISVQDQATSQAPSSTVASSSDVNSLSTARRLLRRETFSKSRPAFTNECGPPPPLPPTSRSTSLNAAASINATTTESSSDTANDIISSTAPAQLSSSPPTSSNQKLLVSSISNNDLPDQVDQISSNSLTDSVSDEIIAINSRSCPAQSNDMDEEAFFSICNDGSIPFDENLIDASNLTPPPSYSEVLSEENSIAYQLSHGAVGFSDEFADALSPLVKRKILQLKRSNTNIASWEIREKLIQQGVCSESSAPSIVRLNYFFENELRDEDKLSNSRKETSNTQMKSKARVDCVEVNPKSSATLSNTTDQEDPSSSADGSS